VLGRFTHFLDHRDFLVGFVEALRGKPHGVGGGLTNVRNRWMFLKTVEYKSFRPESSAIITSLRLTGAEFFVGVGFYVVIGSLAVFG
jgi:hypothetical protein